eukprot:COSAG02_NODE_2701_length_8203_cov_7.719521_3_plen_86_part_00
MVRIVADHQVGVGVVECALGVRQNAAWVVRRRVRRGLYVCCVASQGSLEQKQQPHIHHRSSVATAGPRSLRVPLAFNARLLFEYE